MNDIPLLNPDETDSSLAFAESAREVLLSVSPLARLRAFREAQPAFDRKVWKTLADAGWFSILAPEETGGLGLGMRHTCAVAEQIGRNPLPEPVLSALHTSAILASLPRFEQRDVLLQSICSGDLIIGTAWQERAGQLEPEEALTTRAARIDGGFRLSGVKRWVAPGAGADGWIVSAAAGSDAGIWWVPSGTRGLTAVEDRRVDGSTCTTLTLDSVDVPYRFRLAAGDDAVRAMRRGTDMARLAQAAELLGVARQAFDMTLDYIKTRVQFGKPIGANQVLQHRMVDAFTQIALASACLSEAILDSEGGTGQLRAAASRAKARCLHAALYVTRQGVQLHGAIGFTDEYDLGLFLKRALQQASWLGSAEALRLRHHQDSGDRVHKDGLDEEVAPPEDGNWAAMSDDEFRRMVRGFLRRNYPDHLRHPPRRLHWSECKEWYFALSKQGWLAPAWPRENGGMGLAGSKLLAFIEEMEDYGVARLPDQGIINLGPVLIGFGTPEQQARYLPKILSGENVWCQGYSEPNAGSDLASLRTEATVDGDTFVVNGQKIWTTLAQDATHIFALVRTDKTAKKQAGISFLLVDLSSPGITVRPIRNIAGEEEFCEVFFDNVRVPRHDLVGWLNEGWTIAKALLGFERIFVGSPKTPQYALSLLKKIAEARGLFDKESFMARYAELELDVADLKALYGHFAEIVKRGEELPASVSILKIWASETYTAITRLTFDACQEDGGQLGDVDFGSAQVNVLAPLLNAMITTIYAGSNEIQRNIVAKAVLQLPS